MDAKIVLELSGLLLCCYPWESVFFFSVESGYEPNSICTPRKITRRLASNLVENIDFLMDSTEPPRRRFGDHSENGVGVGDVNGDGSVA